MGKSSICPGFRFHPTDVELVMYYLKRKLLGKKHKVDAIAEVNIYDFSPWDLPDKSNLRNGDQKWFFLCPTSKKYATGSRTSRATEKGYWKSTGKDRPVEYKRKKVAMIKTLVFHIGQPPKGKRTNWVMHEYRMEAKDLADAGVIQDAYVLCMLFEKSGAGPKNGAQYGAPFEEEEWDNEEVNGYECSVLFGLSGATNSLNPNRNGSAITNMTLTEPGPSSINTYFTKTRHEDAQANDVVMLTHEDIASILDDDNNTQESKDNGIFKDLANLSNLDNLCEDTFNMFGIDGAGYMLDTFHAADDLDVNLGKVLKG